MALVSLWVQQPSDLTWHTAFKTDVQQFCWQRNIKQDCYLLKGESDSDKTKIKRGKLGAELHLKYKHKTGFFSEKLKKGNNVFKIWNNVIQ